ncbi:hypothetical protein [Shewanella surugensis]|uniref:Glycosyltransferase family 1 protein n=1 Tax=Shewanella surugensis TaxID=212020 RepID=A0ABT0LGM2_9GAMM|nr:hypothetical protein [Shewanella surugensis]MCL1126843.1 hypothetical protein [Shewanella surugensis]
MSIIIFADVNFNIIDGSSVWLQSISNVVSRAGNKVFLVTRHEVSPDNKLATGLDEAVILVDPSNDDYLGNEYKDSLSPYGLLQIIKIISDSHDINSVVIRGDRFLAYILDKSEYIITPYIINLNNDYQVIDKMIRSNEKINNILVQTERARSLIENKHGIFSGKVEILSPMVPEYKAKTIKKRQIIYTGKSDKDYLVEEYIDHKMNMKKIYIGDKFNHNKEDKFFVKRMKNKLNTKGILWLGGMKREETIRQVAKSTFSYNFRSNKFNYINEVSTKLLESMSVGTLPILNKTNANIRLLGDNYPYYINKLSDIKTITTLDREKEKLWAKKVKNIAQKYTFKSISISISKIFNFNKELKNKKILIASHDIKFINKFKEELIKSGAQVKIDQWKYTATGNIENSKKMLDWADVIWAEWCVGPAEWYSKNKKKHQKLFIRLHRFELNTDFPNKLKQENIDQYITVSPEIKQQCVTEFGWHKEKISVFPQYVNCRDFDREKMPGYEFNLGLVGIVPTSIKRFDRAIQIMEKLIQIDSRYRLYIRSKMPWEFDFIWSDPNEKIKFKYLFDKISKNHLLRDAIYFDEPGSDMANWFKKINTVLSTSMVEGCHTAIAEGLATGCNAILFPWEGASSVYSGYPVVDNIDDAVTAILEVKIQPKANKLYAREHFDIGLLKKFFIKEVIDEI